MIERHGHDMAGPFDDAIPPVVQCGGAQRVVLVLARFGLGGAQRVAAAMAAYWTDCGHEVVVVTWLVDGEPDFFPLPPAVGRVRLSEPDGRLRRLRRALVRWIEESRPVGAVRSPDRRGPRAGLRMAEPRPRISAGDHHPAGRCLHWLRAAYASLFVLRNAALGFVARRRLLGRARAAYMRLVRIGYWQARTLRRFLARDHPDVVISLIGQTNVFTVAASAGLPHRVVVSERNDPAKQHLGIPWDDLREVVYAGADVVTANSAGALAAMRAYCPAAKLRFVPNPLVMPGRTSGAARRDAVLFLGRLEPQKAPDVLVEAFARFAREAPGWRLDVAGDGSLRVALQQRMAALGMVDAVHFHGAVADPEPLLAACRIFALPSRFEGTPNALLEAMAHRMACIVSDASPGPLQLIEHDVTGLVVKTGSVTGLACALARLAGDVPLRDRLAAAAGDRVREFGLDRVGPQWDRIVFPAGGHRL